MTKRIIDARSGSEASKSGSEAATELAPLIIDPLRDQQSEANPISEASTEQSVESAERINSLREFEQNESDGFTSQQVIIKNLQQALSDLESSNPQSGLIQISGAN